MRSLRRSILALMVVLCCPGCPDDPPGPTSADLASVDLNSVDLNSAADATPVKVDWELELDLGAPAGDLLPALLGQYDLSGALFSYDKVSGLKQALARTGFTEWRVSVGRWEVGTQILPSLTDGTACPFPLARAKAPPGTTDLDLIKSRDWFVDDGQPVTLAMTQQDSRYALDYLRSVLAVCQALGTRPFVSIDMTPRALAANRAPQRTICDKTFTNKVSNAKPADPVVFASAVAGLVRRIVEGSHGRPGVGVTHFEVGNEPDLDYFWDKSLDPKMEAYYSMAVTTLVALDAYRTASSHKDATRLRFGMGGFAQPKLAEALIKSLDAKALPSGGHVPLDFVSFHAYDNDPLLTVKAIADVKAAARGSTHYKDLELVLSEWGPDLAATGGDKVWAASMEPPLLMSTVLALGASAGLDRSHHTFFYDFYNGAIVWGLVTHDVKARPLAHAYAMLAQLIGAGARRLAATGYADGRLDQGQGAVLAAREQATGEIRALLINRGSATRTARLSLAKKAVAPKRVLVFDDPSRAPTTGGHTAGVVTVPARSLVLVELGGG